MECLRDKLDPVSSHGTSEPIQAPEPSSAFLISPLFKYAFPYCSCKYEHFCFPTPANEPFVSTQGAGPPQQRCHFVVCFYRNLKWTYP